MDATLGLITVLFDDLVVFVGTAFTAFVGTATFADFAATFTSLGAGLAGAFDVVFVAVLVAVLTAGLVAILIAGLTTGLLIALAGVLAIFLVAAVLVELFVTTDVSFFAGFFIALAIESNQPKLKSYLKFIKRKHCHQPLPQNRTLMQKSNSTFLSIGVLGYSEEHMLT
nr:hypothetical protein [uncultured Undibacterium sp.]